MTSPRWSAVAAAAATALAVLTAGASDLIGAAPLAAALAACAIAARRWPVAALLTGAACVVAVRTAGLVEIGWLWPAAFLFYTAAGTRRGLIWATGTGAFVLLFAANWHATVAPAPLTVLGLEALGLLAVVSLAQAARNRALWRDEQEKRLERLAEERRLANRNRAVEERLHIARELHDVIGHTLTAVGVQLRVAAEVLADSPEEAAEALAAARRVRAEAFGDLRALVTALRTGEDAATDPRVDAGVLDRLTAPAREAGLAVTVTVEGDTGLLPSAVGLAVHRVVAESLTNAVRHSGASRVAVRLDCAPARAVVEVADDGGIAAPPAFGNGLSGLRERVTALGGRLTVTAEAGLHLRAEIPVPRSAA
ncbi:histidine kinase [Phytomonospora sp. NPDC050363]|uniref:sensor histidine kinase n=1 Tax=Phytomonospora sp. NPDC050363 TaxID=3155642 RepID=UPI0033F5652B